MLIMNATEQVQKKIDEIGSRDEDLYSELKDKIHRASALSSTR